MESRDSSSPLITRAVAAALRNELVNTYEFPAWQRLALQLIGRLPQTAALNLIPRVQAPEAVDPARLEEPFLDGLIKTRLADYDQLPERYPAITIGVGMGGATAHLATQLGGPFLPQAFVVTMKGGSKDGDVRRYFQQSKELALSVAERYPEVLTIQHFDPVHDGWLTLTINHLRLKLLRLPQAYRDFLLKRLQPGGEVCYLSGGAQWLRYRVGERSVFQVGGWGDIPAKEFIQGSPRLEEFARREGLSQSAWALDGYPLESGPESEWGSEAGLKEDLENFCQDHGFQFRCIHRNDPNDFARLAFAGQKRLIERAGQEPQGILVEMFSQYDVTTAMRSGLLPLWLIFNTHDSVRFLKEMTGEFPREKPVFFSPLATFSRTPDLAPWREWVDALRGYQWLNIGTRASHYPADTLALLGWHNRLRAWSQMHSQPVEGQLSLDDLEELANNL